MQSNASAIPSSEMVDNMERYKPLYEACVEGDWDSVKRLVEFNPDPNLWTTRIDTSGNPVLCVAALSGQTELIRNLVELMPGAALLATDYSGYTALHYIAKNGDVEAAKILVTKNPLFTQIPNFDCQTPLLVAAHYGCKEMVRYLVTVTKDEASDRWPYWPSPFRGEQGAALLVSLINFDLYDVALNLVKNYEGIATATNSYGMSAISALARKSWPDRQGLRELIECICCTRHQYSLLLHNAIKYKQKEIFYYLKHPKFKNELSTLKISDGGDTILHLAANISPSHVLNKIPGAALQVQHDVKWYKEVAAMVPFYENIRNCEGWTPEDIFYEKHQALIREGEKWMQNKASSSMVVATLIATVVFAAAFTVPGGTRSDMELQYFVVFEVFNAMALLFSLTSVLIFLSILTATYGMEGFLVSLPQRLIIGEVVLFFAIYTMIIAFIINYFIILGQKLLWLTKLIGILFSVPMVLFLILQTRFFFDIIKSTYMSSL